MKQKQIDLRMRRQQLGLTLEEVAVQIGMTAPMVRNIELRTQRGSLATRLKIARVLKVHPRTLLTKTETEDFLTGARQIEEKGRAK